MFKNDYDYEYAMIKYHCRYDGFRIIDHEKDTYLSFMDANGNIHSLWFNNGRLTHEI